MGSCVVQISRRRGYSSVLRSILMGAVLAAFGCAEPPPLPAFEGTASDRAGGGLDGPDAAVLASVLEEDPDQVGEGDQEDPVGSGTASSSSSMCGDGELDSDEECDTAIEAGEGACPSQCDTANACQTGQLMGEGCDARCVFEDIGVCQDGDGCCPSSCGTLTDDDCSLECGDGRIEGDELCDGNCPGAPECDDGVACTADGVVGSSATCDAVCSNTAISACAHDDGCCAPGCNSVNDNDCSASCGNDVVEGAETCDGADCPSSCDDTDICTVDSLAGSAGSCSAQCSFVAVTACADGDGCCAPGCNSNNDNDCAPDCGNGVSESGELCDGNCPTSCGSDENTCTTDLALSGSAGNCDALCAYEPITVCSGGDQCCPNSCDNNTDPDCSATCGNGTLEAGETCEPGVDCPADCDDSNACTSDGSSGLRSSCTFQCSHVDITSCIPDDGCCPSGCNNNNDNDCGVECGNGEVEPGETCDGNCPMTCDVVTCAVETLVTPGNACTAACTYTPIDTCVDSDGCCAPGCNSTNDNNCSPVCGNGILESGEVCDGTCPTSCNDGDACTYDDPPLGEGCSVTCSNPPITACSGGDGCCAPGCNNTNDSDCDPVCGNGVLESGEQCEGASLPTAACDGNCQDICVWVIEYQMDSVLTVAEATTGNGPYDQPTLGTIIMQFTDDGGAPGDGPAGMRHSVSKTELVISAFGSPLVTDVTVTAGADTTTCPLATGTLSGSELTWGSCPYMSSDWGSTDFDPTDQQVPAGQDAGCLTVHAVGNVNCGASGFICGFANLSPGDNPQDDIWDQPIGRTIFDFAGFAGGSSSSVTFGGTSYPGSPVYPDPGSAPSQATDNAESPTHATSRLWRNSWSVSEVSRACVPPPSGCN